jgi:vancomycin permeability regulator SanA
LNRVIKLFTLLLAAVLTYLCITAAAIVSFSEKDETRPADTAIVLGASVYDNSPSPVFCERINHAVDLYNDGYVETIIMTGGVGEGNIRSEADIAREYEEQQGVPAESI